MNGHSIINSCTPTNANDLTTKKYVDTNFTTKNYIDTNFVTKSDSIIEWKFKYE